MSITTLAATYTVPGLYMYVQSEAIEFLVGLKICIVWTLLKTFCSEDTCITSFACHDDQRLGSSQDKTH